MKYLVRLGPVIGLVAMTIVVDAIAQLGSIWLVTTVSLFAGVSLGLALWPHRTPTLAGPRPGSTGDRLRR